MSASSQAPFPTANIAQMSAVEEKMLSTSIDAAKQALLSTGMVLPQAVMLDEEEKVFMIIGEPFGEEDTKDRFALSMRIMGLKHHAVALVFLSEAWAFNTGNVEANYADFEQWRKDNPGSSFSEYPGKGVTEQVMLMFESHSGVGRMSLPIHRTADNTPYILTEELEREYYSYEQLEEYGKPIMMGRFTQLLAPREYWASPNAEQLVAVGEKVLSGFIHDQDSDLVKSLEAEAKKHDERIPRDLQN